MINLNIISDMVNKPKKCDMCKCSNCGWEGFCHECETEWESEGWEYPSYQVHLCPKCDDGGCIDDYWYSDDCIDE